MLTGSYDPTQDSRRGGTVPPTSSRATPSLSSGERRTARRQNGTMIAAHAEDQMEGEVLASRWSDAGCQRIAADVGESEEVPGAPIGE